MVDRNQPLFMISVVCELFQVHPQTLRLYEREGLIHPQRVGRTRMYSQEDLHRLRTILSLSRDLGVNRSGIDIILRMRQRMEALQREMEDMMDHLEADLRNEFRERIQEVLESSDDE